MCRLLIAIFLLSSCAGAFADTDTNEMLVASYLPYLHGKPWARWPVIAYVETESNIWVHPTDPKHFPTIEEICETNSDFATVILRLPDGTSYKTYNDLAPVSEFSEVYLGDFNGDGKPDFLAVEYSGGCGLAAENCTGVFAFSDGSGSDYNFTRIRSMDLCSGNLVIDLSTRQFRLVQTSFRQGLATDGRDHSFWVHRFFIWTGNAFIPDTSLPAVWIQYLERSNHEPTKLLTPALEQKAWDEDPDSDNIEW